MHKYILSQEQIKFLPALKRFRREFYLAGGTAVALYIGHRRSIDFDLFKYNKLKHKNIINKIISAGYNYNVYRSAEGQLNMNIENVRITFLEYPFKINTVNDLNGFIRIPDLADLAAMKAYALGRRSKWKDYVDLYFILRDYLSIEEISERAEIIFEQLFSEKLFRAQLCYFEDIDYTEEIEFMNTPVNPSEIKGFLIQKASEIKI